MIIDASKSHITTTRDYIAVKPDGKVVICRQNMHTGKVQEMSLTVDFDGNVRVYEAWKMDGGQATMYDELVNRLREPCQYENCVLLCKEAADAIEKLSRVQEQWITQERNALLKEIEKLKGEITMDSNKYYIVRADRAGVFFGHIKERTGNEVTMTDVRRLWYWEGAASLSQMAVDGVSRPCNCKFTMTVPEMTILGVIEIIPCTDKAASSILGVKEWRA